MQTKIVPVLIAATLLTCGARAENEPTAPTQAPTPQPVATAPTNQAPAAAQTAPAPSQVIYSPRLPSPAELTNVANAQGLAIEQINQTASQVTVIYRNSAGQRTTVAYQLLPTSAAPANTVVVPSPAPQVIYQTQPTVIYQTQPRVVYYDTYDPWYWNPPVSLNFGFGYYHGGWGHGYYRGGYHHWR